MHTLQYEMAHIQHKIAGMLKGKGDTHLCRVDCYTSVHSAAAHH
jgi:hypothetical protein